MPLVAGQRLGPYQIQTLVGAGGMGEVYRALDTRLGRTVAVKVLPTALAADVDRRARFEREAKTIASLDHAHICTLHDVGEQDGAMFLVMEHLEGGTLAERLKKGSLPIDQAFTIAIDIAEALSEAHRHGIIHRDLKPGNVMLTKAGAKLLDFGLAKLTGHGEQAAAAQIMSVATRTAPLTGQGVIVGTLQYMAPEQLEGKCADARTDLWALGAIVYEMVTGRRAFEGTSAASLIGAILEREPPPPASVQPVTPPALERVIRQCLAKTPDDRPDTAHDVANELRWAREVSGVVAAGRVPVRRARLLLSGIGWLLLVALLASFVVWRLRPLPVAPVVVRATIDLPAGTRVTGERFPARTEFAFSRDGQYLAFSATHDGTEAGAMLYLRRLDRADAEPVKGTEGARQPFFSPDGQWIGFWANGKLSKVPRDGGIPTDLLACPFPPKGAFWTEDGTVLLGGGGLRRIPIDGGAAEELTRVDPNRETEHNLPFLLPDGATVLFTATPDFFGHRAQVEAVSLHGGTRHVVIQDAADARYLPTGHIVFVRQGILMAAAFDASRLEAGPPVPVVHGVEQALNVGGSAEHSGAGQFSVSDSGALAYAVGGVNHFLENELVWVDREGRTETLGGFDRSEVSNQVRLSPDGGQVAFIEQAGPLWSFDLERAAYTRVSPPEGLAGAPRWTPDGRRLIFGWTAAGPGKHWQVAIGEGSDTLEPLATDAESGWLSSWSQDGRFLALVGSTAETSWDILIYTAEDQKIQPFLQTRSIEAYPEFSPDGRWLAYVSDESGRREVYLRSFPDPSRRVQISNQGGDQPAWSADARELFYVSPPPRKMMKVDLRLSPDVWVGRPQALFDFVFLTCLPVRGYDLSRDGRRFLVTRTTKASTVEITRINLVQNWFEELKAKVPVK